MNYLVTAQEKEKLSLLLFSKINRLTDEERMTLFCYMYAILETFREHDNPHKLILKQLLANPSEVSDYSSEIIRSIFAEVMDCINVNKRFIVNKALIETVSKYSIYLV